MAHFNSVDRWYSASVLFWLIVSLIRDRGSRDYAAFCQIFGMCFFWPLTIFLEAAISVANRRARRDRIAAVKARLAAEEAAIMSGNEGSGDGR